MKFDLNFILNKDNKTKLVYIYINFIKNFFSLQYLWIFLSNKNIIVAIKTFLLYIWVAIFLIILKII